MHIKKLEAKLKKVHNEIEVLTSSGVQKSPSVKNRITKLREEADYLSRERKRINIERMAEVRSKKQSHFAAGIVHAAAIIINDHNLPQVAVDIINKSGFDLNELRFSSKSDLDSLRPYIDNLPEGKKEDGIT